jgi:hypothetical protein
VILRLLKLPFRLVGFVFSLVFVGGILEVLGLMFYMQWRDEAALNAFIEGGITVSELIGFLTASPDRMLVAGGLAVLALLMVLGGNSGGSTSHGGFGDGGHGGFGGDGGGGGGDGGGGE